MVQSDYMGSRVGSVVRAPSQTHVREHERVDFIAVISLVAFYIGVYLNISIYSGQQPVVPDIIAVIAAAVFMMMRREYLTARPYLFMAQMTLVAIGLLLVTTVTHGWLSTKSVNGTGNLVISWFVAYAGFLMVKANTRRVNSLVFAGIWITLIVGALLELTGPLREISDAFRAYAYRYMVLNNDVTRDVLYYGSYRPKVFASEPSLVGVWFSVALVSWLLLYPVKLWSRRTLIFFAALAVMFYIERSPTLLFCVPAFGYALFSQPGDFRPGSRTWQYARLGGIIAALVGFGIFLVATPTAGLFQFMQGGSFYFRMVAPPGLTAQILTDYPTFGIGMGNQELLQSEAIGYFMAHYNTAKEILSMDISILTIVANGFYQQWIYAGIVGAFVLMLIYLRFLSSLEINDSAAVLAMWMLFLHIIAGYVTIGTWAIFFLFAGVRLLYEKEQPARG